MLENNFFRIFGKLKVFLKIKNREKEKKNNNKPDWAAPAAQPS